MAPVVLARTRHRAVHACRCELPRRRRRAPGRLFFGQNPLPTQSPLGHSPPHEAPGSQPKSQLPPEQFKVHTESSKQSASQPPPSQIKLHSARPRHENLHPPPRHEPRHVELSVQSREQSPGSRQLSSHVSSSAQLTSTGSMPHDNDTQTSRARAVRMDERIDGQPSPSQPTGRRLADRYCSAGRAWRWTKGVLPSPHGRHRPGRGASYGWPWDGLLEFGAAALAVARVDVVAFAAAARACPRRHGPRSGLGKLD